MPAKRYLIVNADDFGLSAGVNRGVIEAHERGIVTSASLMVRRPAAAEAAAYARQHPAFSLGLHVDLGEWAYRDGEWAPLYEVVRRTDAAEVESEVLGQLAAFRRLVGRNPTHLDSHQHVHLREPARRALLEVARAIEVPLRHFSPAIRHCGSFYGQTVEGAPLPDAIGVGRLLAILAALPEGTTELVCHPGKLDDLETMYRSERAREVKTLCDPRVWLAIQELDVDLCSFADAIAHGRRSGEPASEDRRQSGWA
jgi:chitin disaccharide deacetylase